MIVTTVSVWVKTEYIDQFIDASIDNHRGSVEEPGNLRFDILQSKDDPSRFLLYEAYESEEASRAHKEKPHYRKWKETVADWMAKPREGKPHMVIAPDNVQCW